jgi:hypothetical protein
MQSAFNSTPESHLCLQVQPWRHRWHRRPPGAALEAHHRPVSFLTLSHRDRDVAGPDPMPPSPPPFCFPRRRCLTPSGSGKFVPDLEALRTAARRRSRRSLSRPARASRSNNRRAPSPRPYFWSACRRAASPPPSRRASSLVRAGLQPPCPTLAGSARFGGRGPAGTARVSFPAPSRSSPAWVSLVRLRP